MAKQKRTIKLQIREHVEVFVDTMRAFVGACNQVSHFAHAEQLFDARELQQHLYYDLREEWGLRSQMTCSAIRLVASLYKHREVAQRCRRRERGIFFQRLAMPLQSGRDWELLSDGRVSLNSLQGRLKVTCKWGAFQRRYLDSGWDATAARLVWKKGRLELHITIESEAPQPRQGDKTVGVDVGQNNLATLSDEDQAAAFWKGGLVKDTQRKYRKLYQSLQAKGTRGALRCLKRLSGKQRRWQTQINHEIANKVLEKALSWSADVLGLENLTGIRQHSTRRTARQRADFHGWSFYQLQQMIVYKAIAVGISVLFVNPYNTSKTCPCCKKLSNRDRHRFQCKHCSFELNADLAAARNIARRASAQRHASQRRAPVNEPLRTTDDAYAPSGMTQVEVCSSFSL